MNEEIYSRVISENLEKVEQTRLSITEFYGVEYLSLRNYYMDFDGEWKPTNKGINIPLTIENSRELFAGLVEILSLAESKEVIIQEFRELLSNTYDT